MNAKYGTIPNIPQMRDGQLHPTIRTCRAVLKCLPASYPTAGGQALVGLWATDGTAEGTELVFGSDPTDDSLPLEPANFFVLDTLLIFSGLTAAHGTELWRSDGTAV
ncbi:MAG: hypothetical protein AB8H12_24680 [Lewinella sp.]